MGKKKSTNQAVEENEESIEIPAESETSEHVEDVNDESATKRKNPFTGEAKPPKRKKQKNTTEEGTQPADENGENGNVLPAAPLSKRQKKKQKKLLNMAKSKDKEIERAIAYLNKWDTERDEWKYEKLRQIFLQKHILDANVIDDEHGELAIKYLATSKGQSRKVLLDAAEAFIKSIEDKLSDENRDELLNSSGYKRARELMQSLQD